MATCYHTHNKSLCALYHHWALYSLLDSSEQEAKYNSSVKTFPHSTALLIEMQATVDVT
jgi:hypothetical protein